jgi:predicted MPP superfamily phosphohydrolase
MFKFIQLTDFHIGKHGDKDRINLDAIVRHIIDYFPPSLCPVILLTGDFIHDRSKEQYDEVVAALRPLKVEGYKLLACPGNHDFGQGGEEAKGQHTNIVEELTIEFNYDYAYRSLYLEKIHKDLCGEVNVDLTKWNNRKTIFPQIYPIEENKIVFIGLDTMHSFVATKKKELPFGRGKIDTNQLTDLQTALKKYKDYVKVVYMHHNLHDTIWLGMNLVNANALRKILEKANVDLLCYGHLHVLEKWEPDGLIKLTVSGHNVTEAYGDSKNKLKYHLYTEDAGEITLQMIEFDKNAV